MEDPARRVRKTTSSLIMATTNEQASASGVRQSRDILVTCDAENGIGILVRMRTRIFHGYRARLFGVLPAVR